MATKVIYTVKPSGGDFTSIKAAVDAIPNKDLVSQDIQIDIVCYKGDYSAVGGGINFTTEEYFDLTGFVDDATRYLRITVPETEYHKGKLFDSNGNYNGFAAKTIRYSGLRLNAGNGYSIVENLIIQIGGSYAVYNYNGWIVRNCIAYAPSGSSPSGGFRDNGSNPKVLNSVYISEGGLGVGFYSFSSNAAIYNCVSINAKEGFKMYGAGAKIANCIGYNCATNDYGYISANSTKSFLASTDSTGTSGLQNLTNINFVDLTSYDIHLTQSIGSGEDLSADTLFPFDFDIDYEPRNNWDIGADEFLSGDFQASGSLSFGTQLFIADINTKLLVANSSVSFQASCGIIGKVFIENEKTNTQSIQHISNGTFEDGTMNGWNVISGSAQVDTTWYTSSKAMFLVDDGINSNVRTIVENTDIILQTNKSYHLKINDIEGYSVGLLVIVGGQLIASTGLSFPESIDIVFTPNAPGALTFQTAPNDTNVDYVAPDNIELWEDVTVTVIDLGFTATADVVQGSGNPKITCPATLDFVADASVSSGSQTTQISGATGFVISSSVTAISKIEVSASGTIQFIENCSIVTTYELQLQQTTLQFSESCVIGGNLIASATANLQYQSNASLVATGSIGGQSNISFSTIGQAHTVNQITCQSTNTYSTVCAISGGLSLSGASSLNFDTVVILSSRFNLTCSAQTSYQANSSISATAIVQGQSYLNFQVTVAFGGNLIASGTSTLKYTGSLELLSTAEILANAQIDFFGGISLNALKDITGSSSLQFVPFVNFGGGVLLIGNTTLNFQALSSLEIGGLIKQILGASTLNLTSNATFYLFRYISLDTNINFDSGAILSLNALLNANTNIRFYAEIKSKEDSASLKCEYNVRFVENEKYTVEFVEQEKYRVEFVEQEKYKIKAICKQ